MSPTSAEAGAHDLGVCPYRSTRQVADELGIEESVAHDAVRRRLIPAVPIIGHSRLWNEAAVAALRDLLARRAEQRRLRGTA
ncbi:MAG: hypothetical protein K8T90_12200 [Planctomycetes bacterium]|nr:hypothetical protein [Planctomycetota bacterium]